MSTHLNIVVDELATDVQQAQGRWGNVQQDCRALRDDDVIGKAGQLSIRPCGWLRPWLGVSKGKICRH